MLLKPAFYVDLKASLILTEPLRKLRGKTQEDLKQGFISSWFELQMNTVS